MPNASLSALHGRIVTMDPDDAVFDDGVIYLRDHTIVAIADADEPPPAGFEQIEPVRTGATLYPGLIDLHVAGAQALHQP
jgi:5-methylthioadenosine/S-adenosylhomocysteine deaminase